MIRRLALPPEVHIRSRALLHDLPGFHAAPANEKPKKERRKQNAALFTAVVHINPEAVLATYEQAKRGAVRDIREHVSAGRLVSLEQWLKTLAVPDR